MTAEELTDLLRRRNVGDGCKEVHKHGNSPFATLPLIWASLSQAVIGDSELETLLLVRERGRGVADEGRGWTCVSTE